QRGRAVSPRDQEAIGELARIGERPSDGADHVQDVMGPCLGQPGGPGSDHVEYDLQRPGPATAPGRLMNGERTAQQEVPFLGHPDLDELSRLGPLGYLGRHQRERMIGTGSAVREHFAVACDHSVSFELAATSWSSGPSKIGATTIDFAAWYSCSGRGSALL